jgi:hypothetical protein
MKGDQMTNKIEVTDYKENEDGTASIEMNIDKEAQKVLADLGVQFILLCATFEVTTDEMMKKIIEVYEDDHVQT